MKTAMHYPKRLEMSSHSATVFKPRAVSRERCNVAVVLSTCLRRSTVNDMRTAQFEAAPSQRSITEDKKEDLRAMIPYLA